MQGPQKAISIVFTFLIFFPVLAINSRADGNDKGIGKSLQKAPPKMVERQESLCRGL